MKKDIVYVCKECGTVHQKWQGYCNGCKKWNVLQEENILSTSNKKKTLVISNNIPTKMKEIKTVNYQRLDTGYNEFNRVLGNGLVKDSVVLISGDPGIGKSTLLLQACKKLSTYGKVLYISAEESLTQIKDRADRIGITEDDIYLLAENDLNNILNQITILKPSVVILDSIQTVFVPEIDSSAGNPSQVKESTNMMVLSAKKYGYALFVVGHVTKDNSIAGPKGLEHLVDTVLYFEGEKYESLRLLRAIKNRFGSTNEVGIFKMGEYGFTEVENPNELFLSNEKEAGKTITCMMEGTRPVLTEIQSLVSINKNAGMPRRVFNGLDYNRCTMITAILDKHVMEGLSSRCDVFFSVVGGIKNSEPAADLSIALAALSSYYGEPIKEKTVILGEVSLTGEIRSVSNVEKRIKEAERLGFDEVIIPYGNLSKIHDKFKIKIIGVKKIKDAIYHLYPEIKK